MNVYDFDNTIYDGDSSIDFFRFVLGKKPYLLFLLPIQAWGIIRYLLGMGSKENMKEAFFMFIRFISVQEMVFLFWERNRKKIKSWYLEQKQNSDIIISASPEFLLEPLVCGYLGAGLIASRIDRHTGTYTGKNCYGEEKVRRFKTISETGKIDTFFTDSLSDLPLARIAENAFLVCKDTMRKWEKI